MEGKKIIVSDEVIKDLAGETPDPSQVVQKKNPRTRFTEKILKQVIGQERANAALQSLSMGLIPGAAGSAFNVGGKCCLLASLIIYRTY